MEIPKINKVHLFLTDKCNLKCPTCFVDARGKYKDELTTDEWIKVVKEVEDIGVDEVHIEGGEPFLREDLVEIVSSFDDLSKIVIATNGTIPYRAEFKKISGIKRLCFGIEGSTQEIHEKTRASKLEKVIENLEQFQANGFYVNTNTVLTKANYTDLLNIVAMNVKNKVPMTRFAFFEDLGRGEKNRELRLNSQDYFGVIDNFLEAAGKYSSKNQIILFISSNVIRGIDYIEVFAKKGIQRRTNPIPEKTLKIVKDVYTEIDRGNIKINLRKPSHNPAITADGSVHYCDNFVANHEYIITNIRGGMSLEGILSWLPKTPCGYRGCSTEKCSAGYLSTNSTGVLK